MPHGRRWRDAGRFFRKGTREPGSIVSGFDLRARRAAFVPVLIRSILGLAIGAGCATSDMVLERQRRLDIDGGPVCHEGVREECYGGTVGTAGRGACRLGERVCQQGQWSACEGEIVPQSEICNRIDDDCDGIVDNGFERDNALCFREGAQGACRTQGRWHCSPDGSKSICDAATVDPVREMCDGIDNDCDGAIDEDSIPPGQKACETGLPGVCATGTHRCVQGREQCVQDVQPGIEMCNELDDNCNGRVDEDCVRR